MTKASLPVKRFSISLKNAKSLSSSSSKVSALASISSLVMFSPKIVWPIVLKPKYLTGTLKLYFDKVFLALGIFGLCSI